MAITTSTYNSYKRDAGVGTVDWLTDTIKVALVTSSYSVDVDLHTFFDDITNEITGTGYVAGGATVGTKTATQDNTDNEGVMDAANTTWSTATFTARGAVVYKVGASAATSPLIGFINFGQDESPSAANFTITWNAEGIINFT